MILVTGLGRCGTSVLMKYLKEVKFCIGFNYRWYNIIRAGYELREATGINVSLWQKNSKPINLDDNILDSRGRAFEKTYREAINQVDDDGFIEVIKDPRLTWHPDIIETWWAARQDIKLIICHRDIESVMKSRNALPREFADPKGRTLLQYKEDFADFFTKVLQLGIPYEILFFPNFLRNFHSTYEALDRVGLSHDYEVGKKVWYALVDQTLLKEV